MIGQVLTRELKETGIFSWTYVDLRTVNEGVRTIFSIDGSSKFCMIVLPQHSCIRQNGESGLIQIKCTTFFSQVVKKVAASIEVDCSIALCIDCTTISTCCVVGKVADSVEANYSMVIHADHTTTTIIIVVG